jgi:hypothetical protein
MLRSTYTSGAGCGEKGSLARPIARAQAIFQGGTNMSDVDGGITQPEKDGKKLRKIKIEGKLPETDWEKFKLELKQFIEGKYPNLKVK